MSKFPQLAVQFDESRPPTLFFPDFLSCSSCFTSLSAAITFKLSKKKKKKKNLLLKSKKKTTKAKSFHATSATGRRAGTEWDGEVDRAEAAHQRRNQGRIRRGLLIVIPPLEERLTSIFCLNNLFTCHLYLVPLRKSGLRTQTRLWVCCLREKWRKSWLSSENSTKNGSKTNFFLKMIYFNNTWWWSIKVFFKIKL